MNLTQRQHEVAELIADGYPDKQIMALLGISRGTLRVHLREIVVRLKLDSTKNFRSQITRAMAA